MQNNFAPEATFVIHGVPELAGTFTGREPIIAGLDRMFQLVPTHVFTIEEVWITTGPEEVTAAVAWTDAAELASGENLPAHGMNRLRIGPLGLLEEHLFIAPDDGWPE